MRQTSMPPAVFEPATSTSERPQTHTLDRTATGIVTVLLVLFIYKFPVLTVHTSYGTTFRISAADVADMLHVKLHTFVVRH
jgi:hypothetical protein